MKSGYEAYFKRRFRRSRTEDIEGGFRILGEKGRWTRLAVTGVHLSVVLLLVGALIGSLFGFDGYVNEKVAVEVIEGARSTAVQVYGRRSRHSSIVFENSLKKIAADLSGMK